MCQSLQLEWFCQSGRYHSHLPLLTKAQKQREAEQTRSVVVALAALVCMCVSAGEKVGKRTV